MYNRAMGSIQRAVNPSSLVKKIGSIRDSARDIGFNTRYEHVVKNQEKETIDVATRVNE
jgi:hypothetical protein